MKNLSQNSWCGLERSAKVNFKSMRRLTSRA